jgi:hypothetical protein
MPSKHTPAAKLAVVNVQRQKKIDLVRERVGHVVDCLVSCYCYCYKNNPVSDNVPGGSTAEQL